MIASEASVPKFRELMLPTLEAMKELGGSGHIDEISQAVIEREGFTEEQQSIRRRPGDRMSLIEYRLAWARNYLKNIGAIENSSRGVWSITDLGRELTQQEIDNKVRQWKREYGREYSQRRRGIIEDEDDDASIAIETENWKDILISRLQQISPDAFERLAQRILREAGFRNVEVVGRTGDGGIDGVGVYRISLVSFPVFFQCKRYRGSVRAGLVRDFRGAMSGRGERGLLITTGTFTREARREAAREGAPPVDLIDGDDLCELLKSHGLGVLVQEQRIEQVHVEDAFFDQL